MFKKGDRVRVIKTNETGTVVNTYPHKKYGTLIFVDLDQIYMENHVVRIKNKPMETPLKITVRTVESELELLGNQGTDPEWEKLWGSST